MFEKYLISVIIFIMVLSGCVEENPLENSAPAAIDDITIINLPKSSGEQVETFLCASDFINGHKGGDVLIDKQYKSQTGAIKIYARIKFKRGAFTGTKLIKMAIDDVNGTISFDPPTVFNRHADLDMKIEGIDLSGKNRNKVDFVYINPNGAFEPVKYKSMSVDVPGKLLEVKDAEINHFSRYGWCR